MPIITRFGWKQCQEAIRRIPAPVMRIGVIAFCVFAWILAMIAVF